MVTPGLFTLALLAGLLMLALILGLAFVPDNTKDWGIDL